MADNKKITEAGGFKIGDKVEVFACDCRGISASGQSNCGCNGTIFRIRGMSEIIQIFAHGHPTHLLKQSSWTEVWHPLHRLRKLD